jgi:hypothetical protein
VSEKITYIYRVEIGHHPNVEKVEFCYARNSSYAIYNFQEIYKDQRYNMFKTYKVGEVDYKKHPGPFELLPKDEEEYIRKIRSTVGEEYAERRNNVPGLYENIDFGGLRRLVIQGQNEEPVQADGERVPYSDK